MFVLKAHKLNESTINVNKVAVQSGKWGYPQVSRYPNMLWSALFWFPPRMWATGTGSIATVC